MKFNVEFTINRLTLRLQHRAAEFAATHNLENVLFPAAPLSNFQQTELPKLRLGTVDASFCLYRLGRQLTSPLFLLFFLTDRLFDSQLERNPEQFRAVQHIVSGSSKPAPYLVFGPPGTGTASHYPTNCLPI